MVGGLARRLDGQTTSELSTEEQDQLRILLTKVAGTLARWHAGTLAAASAKLHVDGD